MTIMTPYQADVARAAAQCDNADTRSLCLPNPVYHQVAFALIMISSCARSAYLISLLPRANRAKLARTLGFGVGVFALGFAIWNADNYFCEHLRAARAYLQDRGLGGLGHFTEGHGWWHLLTGYGAQQIFTACIELCLCHKTSPDAWSYDNSAWVPIVHRSKVKGELEDERGTYSNGYSNGYANGYANGYTNGGEKAHAYANGRGNANANGTNGASALANGSATQRRQASV